MTNANPVSNLPPHPACVCGKGKVRGFLCWDCFEAADDESSRVKPTTR